MRKKRIIRRYGVDVVFSDGTHVTLRDFPIAERAAEFAEACKYRHLYPNRVYRIEIVPFEVDLDEPEH